MNNKKRRAISEKKRRLVDTPLFSLLIFSLPFIVCGAGVLMWFVLLPVSEVAAARNWVAVPANIESASAVTYYDSNEASELQVSYTYRYGQHHYRSTRYGFYDDDLDDINQLAQTLNSGLQQTAYVNPDNPFEAVLERGFAWWRGLLGLVIGVGFLLAGLYVAWASLGGKKHAAAPPEDTSKVSVSADNSMRTGEPLTPKKSSKVKKSSVVTGALFTVTYNVSCLYVMYSAINDGFKMEDIFIFILACSIPVLIGIGLIFATRSLARDLNNPSVILRLTRTAPITLGHTLGIQWQIEGKVERLDNLSVHLIGKEQARYSHGTDTLTDDAVFYEQSVAIDPTSTQTGHVKLDIPDSIMPTWNSKHNAIVWQLQVKGEISDYSDVDDTYLLTVLPAK